MYHQYNQKVNIYIIILLQCEMALAKLKQIIPYELGKQSYEITKVVNKASKINNELLEKIITILFGIIND